MTEERPANAKRRKSNMLERVSDYRRINRIATWHPVFVTNEWIYLIEKEEGIDLGLLAFEKDRDGYRFHLAMGIKCRGQKAIESIKRAIDWIFENTEAKAIYAVIPEDNKPASIVVIQAGLCYTKTEDKYRYYEVMRWVD